MQNRYQVIFINEKQNLAGSAFLFSSWNSLRTDQVCEKLIGTNNFEFLFFAKLL